MKKEKKIKESKKSKELVLSFEVIKEMANLGKTIGDLNKIIKEYEKNK